jgi:hypothetical protein
MPNLRYKSQVIHPTVVFNLFMLNFHLKKYSFSTIIKFFAYKFNEILFQIKNSIPKYQIYTRSILFN